MRIIPISELCYTNIDFEIEDIFPVRWSSRKDFSLYLKKPRPCSALFFVSTDIEVTFFTDENISLIARQGDIVFIPKGISYRVTVSGNAGVEIDTYTINYNDGTPTTFDVTNGKDGNTVIRGNEVTGTATAPTQFTLTTDCQTGDTYINLSGNVYSFTLKFEIP